MKPSEVLIKERLTKYTIFKNQIQYLNVDDEEKKNYVDYVDKTFEIFRDYEKVFIFNVFVSRKNYDDINYTRSSYYYLKNKLNDILYEILKNCK